MGSQSTKAAGEQPLPKYELSILPTKGTYKVGETVTG